MTFQPWALLITLPPFVVFILLTLEMRRDKARLRDPFTDGLLRPPGETLRLKLISLDEQLTDRLLILIAPLLCGFFIAVMDRSNAYFYLFFFFVSAYFSWFAAKRVRKTLQLIQRNRLGFEGERIVGQALNQILSSGGEVYHDEQFKGYNIDHVVVALSGVYSVETKARRKGRAKNDEKVKYDGRRLIYPNGEDRDDVEQALNNAKSLSVWLTSAVGEFVGVEPILTLPGWWIDRVGTGKVNVLNHKEIVGFIKRRPAIISPEQMRRICHQLRERNVITAS